MSSQSLAVALLSVVSCVCLPVSADMGLCFCPCEAFVEFAAFMCTCLCLLNLVNDFLSSNKSSSQGKYFANVKLCFPS